jgi:hypothetical protein
MLYGTPKWDVGDDSTDRIGIRTLTISKFWQASQWGPNTVDPQLDKNFPSPPPVSAGVVLIGQQTRRNGGGFRTFWTFEGVNGDGRSVTFKGRTNSLDFLFDPGFSQVSIQLLPNFAALLAQYGGQVTGDSVLWPPTVPSGQSTTPGFNMDQSGSGKTNPMFGQQDWLRLEGTYSFRYASFTPPTNANVGTILNGNLPGVTPEAPGGRNWLMAPTPWKRRGPVYDITEIYWLSGPGGWPTPIYGGGSGSGSSATGFGSPGATSNFNNDGSFNFGGGGV